MARISILNCLAASVAVAFVVSGCQMSDNKWMTALKERQKPKQNFKGFDEEEEITYWPNKPRRNKTKMTEMPSELKDKLALRSRQKNRDAEVAERLSDGDRLRKSGKLEDARIEYEKALKLSSKNPDVHHRLAIIADKQHQYTVADEHYDAAMKVRPRDANLLSDLGYSHWLRGNMQKSEDILRQALEIDPSHKLAMGTLGTIYAQQNRQSDALAMFRKGASSEAEAQLFMASLFPQGGQSNRNGLLASNGAGHSGPIMPASNSDIPTDMSKLDQEQVTRLMAREKQAAQQRRYEAEQLELERLRRLQNEDDVYQNSQYPVAQNSNRGLQGAIEIGPRGNTGSSYANNSNGYSGRNSYAADSMPGQGGYGEQNYGGNNGYQNQGGGSRADSRLAQDYGDYRGANSQADTSRMNESDIQHAFDQRSQPSNQNGYQPANGYGQSNAQSSASQMATQLGLNAGPGSMFPVMPGHEGGAAPANDSFNNRFGGEFQQAPSQQFTQNQPVQQNSYGSPNGNAQALTGQIESLPVIAPASPTANWGSPSSSSVSWQNNSSATSGWDSTSSTAGGPSVSNSAASNFAASGAAGSGFDSGASLFRDGQNLDSRQAFDRSQAAAAQNSTLRSGNDTSRPYNGSWPNTNSIPSGPNPAQSRSGSSVTSGFGNAPAANSNQVRSAQSGQGSALPQYPFAPSRQ